jgi:chromosomal replication initiation ATPase DnaA
MNKKLSSYEIELSREILKLNKLNGTLLGTLEGMLRLSLDSAVKVEIAETIREARIYNMQTALNTKNLSHKIVEICFDYYNINVEKALDDSRQTEIIKARNFAIHFMKVELNLSSTDISRYFNKTHATILHSLQVTKDRIDFDKAYIKEYKILKDKINSIYI